VSGEHESAPKKPRLEPRPWAGGLPSIAEARKQRGKFAWAPAKFWAWSALILGASFIFWWKRDDSEIQTMRNELLARQRVVREELGPRWFALRDKIEKWTGECAADGAETVDQPALAGWDFRSKAGIYLRLGQGDAQGPEKIRTAALQSLRDGFTACLLRAPNPNPLAGPACKSNKDCPSKQVCNEFEHCAEHAQPYNLRLAYRTMWILTDEWIDDVQAIGKKLTMRGAVSSFDAWNTYDLPVAVDLLVKAEYFLVVVDELAEGQAPPPEPAPSVEPDGGAPVNPSISASPHQARVCLWRLKDDRRVLRVRREAAGRLVGGSGTTDAQSLDAQQRQANACSLALAVREAMGEDTAASVPE
jgi:hypothetical protein